MLYGCQVTASKMNQRRYHFFARLKRKGFCTNEKRPREPSELGWIVLNDLITLITNENDKSWKTVLLTIQAKEIHSLFESLIFPNIFSNSAFIWSSADSYGNQRISSIIITQADMMYNRAAKINDHSDAG